MALFSQEGEFSTGYIFNVIIRFFWVFGSGMVVTV